jgi:hypothetical protein
MKPLNGPPPKVDAGIIVGIFKEKKRKETGKKWCIYYTIEKKIKRMRISCKQIER